VWTTHTVSAELSWNNHKAGRDGMNSGMCPQLAVLNVRCNFNPRRVSLSMEM
jgi:hypothetical protein